MDAKEIVVMLDEAVSHRYCSRQLLFLPEIPGDPVANAILISENEPACALFQVGICDAGQPGQGFFPRG